jgi:hypothetical protein
VLSNGGWELVEADLARSQAVTAFTPEHIVPGAEVSLIAPYRLMITGGQAFLRGFEVATDGTAVTPALVAALNAGPLTVPADDPALLAAIRALGATGGLHISARPDASKEHLA